MTAVRQRNGNALITADLWPHGLTADGRVTRSCSLPAGSTVDDLVACAWDGPYGALAVAVDGCLVARTDWGTTLLRGGEIVTLRAALAGGDDKNPLRVLLQIGVLVAAIVAPPLLFTSPWAQALASAAITVGGGLIVNALAPLPLPDRSGSSPVEPVYSLTGGANRARPYAPLLLVLGEHRVFPDLGAAEYTEIAGDDHYLHQIFNFGLGDLDVGALRIGDTPLDAYEEVETEYGDAQGRVRLVAGNVDTAAGAALEDTAFVERTTAQGTRRIGVDLTGRLFRVSERDGSVLGHSVDIEIEWEAPGVAVERRTLTLMHDSPTPLRRTITYDLGSARAWTVRVRRATDPDSSDRVYDEIAWAALRAYQVDTADYSGQTRLGVRIRATGQLSGRLDRLSAVVRQKVPAWDGARWIAPQASSNPAWLFRWYARGVRIAGRLVAGVGLADTRIDEASIKAWGAWCEARGLGCNLVLDRARSHADVLMLIAQCGRASPSWQTGRLGVVWEDEGRPATALVTPGNIVAGTFAVEYAAGQAADEIAVRYIEPALDWRYNTLRRLVPGAATPPSTTAAITLPGVTSSEQAAIACNLQAARQLYHRRRLSWEMAAEGLSIARGDVVHITHSLIDGGVAGRLAGGTANEVILDRPVNPGAHGAQVMFRLPDGTVHSAAVAPPPGVQGETAVLELDDPLTEAPGADGANPGDILWRFYEADAPPARARITAVEPVSDRRVRFTAIDEVAAYHDAATADLSVPLLPLRVRTPRVLAIAFAENLVRVGTGFAVEIAAVLTVAGDWRGGVLRAAIDDETPRTVARLVDGETTARWLAQPFGTLRVTVTPGTEAAPAGPSFTAAYRITGTLAPPGEPANFLIDLLGDGTRRFRWTPPDDIDLAGILIRYAVDEGNSAPSRGTRAEPEWEDMTPLHRGFLTSSPLETVEPPPGIYVFAARSIDTGGRLSTGDVRIRATLGPQRQGNALLWRCPSGSGWRGTITNAERSDDGLDALEGLGDYTWDDLTTWDEWLTWVTGNGAWAGTEIAYVGEIVDLGAELDVGLRWSADIVGEVVFEVRYGATEEALEAADWTEHEPGTTVNARWLQLRWRISGDGTEVLSLDHLCWSVHAPGAERRLLDRNTAHWEGSAAEGRIVPNDLAVVTDLDVTLQSVGAGWSWTLLSKNDPTRIRIYDGDGNPADALVDIVVRGVEST